MKLQETQEIVYENDVDQIFIEPSDADIVLTDEDPAEEDGGGLR